MAKRTANEAAEMAGDQTGRYFIVTGGYGGIGVETTKTLLSVGGTVIIGCRNEERMNQFIQETLEEMGIDDADRLRGFVLDLNDLENVKMFSDSVIAEYSHIDVLINNAGIVCNELGVTKQGIEKTMGVNVVGHFLLTKELVPLLLASPEGGRVVNLTSLGHVGPRWDREYYENFDLDTNSFESMTQYQQSKLGNILLGKAFSSIYDMDCVSVHPGAVLGTGFGSDATLSTVFSLVKSLFTNFEAVKGVLFGRKTIQQGAATSITAALQDPIVRGGYYADCELTQPAESAEVEEDAMSLFEWCDEITAQYQSK
eukprot:TRINITY_DN10945_c0_g1_i1.p1 TRINITY_DN10945_c0_g1~~TRINITY_DN10945_c0_g1_i1.p1  ORF type:complete len:313 (-),score=48.15 TRINITY_DN10945_c0_g1_i1:40-978(-)